MKHYLKKFLFGILMLLPLQVATGQDIVITVQRDTIYCQIVSVSPTHIHYEQIAENGFTVGSFLPVEQVLRYYRSVQTVEAATSHHKEQPDRPVRPDRPDRPVREKPAKPEYRWLFGAYAGGASLLASTANDEKTMIDLGISKSQAADYHKSLKRGWNIGGDLHFMLTGGFGMGAKYSLFVSPVQKDLTVALNSALPEFVCVGMKETQYIHYAGPSMVFRQWLDANQKIQLVQTLSAGYVHYRNEVRTDPNQYPLFSYSFGTPTYNILTESNAWGAGAGLSLSYFPVSRISVGANAGIMFARLIKAEVSTKESTRTVELSKKDYISLARFDYSLNIRFLF